MPSYVIKVQNLDPDCSNNEYIQTIVVNSCTEYLVRIDPSSTTNGPFNVYVNDVLTYSNVSRTQLIIGYFLNLNCENPPTYLIYASTYDYDNQLDTVFYEVPFNLRWGVGNGLAPEYTTTAWETFINRRINNSDRITNLTISSGITNPMSIGQQFKLEYPIGSGNTSALLLYPKKWGYISNAGLQDIDNPSNIQGMKPSYDNKEEIILSGISYYVAQFTNYQGSEGQKQNWQVISSEI